MISVPLHVHLVNYCLHYILDEYCFEPDYRVLSSIRKEFGISWKHVGYCLKLDHNVLKNIEINERSVEEQAFKMLDEWKQRCTDTCYCNLILAMNEENLCKGVEVLKQKIESCMHHKQLHSYV